MKRPNSGNQTMVYELIPDTVFVDFNRVADEIELAKKIAIETANKIADKIQSDKIYKKFTDIAKGLFITKEIVYKGYQKFNLQYVEIADSRRMNNKTDKRSRKRNSSKHVAKKSEVQIK